jgi:hypothetical protein
MSSQVTGGVQASSAELAGGVQTTSNELIGEVQVSSTDLIGKVQTSPDAVTGRIETAPLEIAVSMITAGLVGPQGPQGEQGPPGEPGASSWLELTDVPESFPPSTHSHTKSEVGLGNVDNTSDADKPISTAQQNALNAKANLASPAFTGTPTAPTAAKGTDSTQIATTAFVQQALGDAVVSYDSIVRVLCASKGNISELTVDQLDTSDMVQRYLNSDTSNVNFIRIYGQNFEIIEATVKDGAPTAQLLDRKQRPLYWLDAERTGVTTTVTAYPVMVYQYDIENRKKLVAKFEVDPQSGDAIPVMIWGAGDQNDRAKGYIVKDQTGFRLRYQKASGDWVELCLGENGIEGTNAALTSLDIYSDGMISEYDDGTVYDWSWVKDVNGRITEITNNTTEKTATITWNQGAKP